MHKGGEVVEDEKGNGRKGERREEGVERVTSQ